VLANPVREGLVRNAEAYPFSGVDLSGLS